jgi:hypothetical protein
MENSVQSSASRGAQEQLSPHVKTHAPKKHWMTEGEKKFDFLTYTGINYGLNVLLSLGAIYWANRTKSGHDSLKGFGEFVGKIPGINKDSAEFIANKSFFLTGGFAVLAPVKWLEDAKTHLVKKWNREIYGTKADTDPAIQRSEREVEEAPKQGWASVISSRCLALIPFYITVGLLWSRTSLLSKITNPELGKMSTDAIRAADKANTAEFSQLAGKGIYFDNPIVWVSRKIGKFTTYISGNKQELARIGEMEKTFPGMIKEGLHPAERDSNHVALPYYFISEAITSAMVAVGMYFITRVMGPVFDKKEHSVTKATEHRPSEPHTHGQLEMSGAPTPLVHSEGAQREALVVGHPALTR